MVKIENFIDKDFGYYEIPLKLDKFNEDTLKKSNTDFYATITYVETGSAVYIKITNVFNQMEIFRATSA